VALSDRLNRLEGDQGLELCLERSCRRALTFVEVIHYSDGTEERIGREPSSLCTTCPNRDGEVPTRISVVEVVKRY